MVLLTAWKLTRQIQRTFKVVIFVAPLLISLKNMLFSNLKLQRYPKNYTSNRTKLNQPSTRMGRTQSAVQSMGFFPDLCSSRLVFEKCRQPRNPRCADRGEGWAVCRTWCRFWGGGAHTHTNPSGRDVYNSILLYFGNTMNSAALENGINIRGMVFSKQDGMKNQRQLS